MGKPNIKFDSCSINISIVVTILCIVDSKLHIISHIQGLIFPKF